jgi:hypothetical protein
MIGGIQTIDLTTRAEVKPHPRKKAATDYANVHRSMAKSLIREIRANPWLIFEDNYADAM